MESVPYSCALICIDASYGYSLGATLKPGNQKPETGIRNPESTNQRKQVLQIRESYFAKLLPVKNKRPGNRNSPSVKIRATAIPSEGYYYENVNKVRPSRP